MDCVKRIINQDWKFQLCDERAAAQKNYADQHWQKVTLPHDWSVHYPLDRNNSSGTGYVCGGIGWYRKHFTLPLELEGKKLFLRFDGIYKNSQVWINGYNLGKRAYGYSTFQYDISDFVVYGDNDNVISVRVSHEDLADSRWFTGSGITRKVTLLAYDAVFPQEYGVFFYVTNQSVEQAEIVVENELAATSHLSDVLVANRLYAANGDLVLEMMQESDFELEQSTKVTNRGVVKKPHCWSPDYPYLYTLETAVATAGKEQWNVIDRQLVGIRTIKFDPAQGFFINGEPEIFKGVCVHHDAGTLGAAVTKEIWRRRLIKLKVMGCNAIRMSHNPHMPELYQLCDELGFFVIDEAFDEWEAPKNKWNVGHNVYPPKHDGYAEDFHQWHEADLSAMVKRDRNHPSVVMWSIGNEVDYPNDPYAHPMFDTMTGNNDHNKPAAERRYDPARPNMERLSVIAKQLAKIVRQNDPTRPVTAGVAFPELSTKIGFIDDLDVVGYNYKEQFYAEDHQRFPDKTFLGSENKHNYAAWKAVGEHKHICGQFLWTGIDYLGETRGWPWHGADFGLLTSAGFEKESYYKRQSWWSEQPVIHIVTARKAVGSGEFKLMHDNWNYVVGEEIEVRCYTNQSDVSLYVNDKLATEQVDTSELGYLTWYVRYEPGYIKAEANGISHTLQTVSAPVQIKLVPVYQNGDDIIQLELAILDANEQLVMADRSLITVSITGDGELVALDNGDLADGTDFTANYRSTYHGQLIIYVRRTGTKPLTITARNPLLKEAVHIIN